MKFDWLKSLKLRTTLSSTRRRRRSRQRTNIAAQLMEQKVMLSGVQMTIDAPTQHDGSHNHGDAGQMTADDGNQRASHHTANPAAMALVSLDQATNTVVASGNWSDPNVWQNGTLPASGARIVIPQGMTLTVDSQIPHEFKTIRIDGTLRFATGVNTELRVDTIVSSPHGRFEMGTVANPVAAGVSARVVFADDGAIDRNWDPSQLSRGAILQGPVEIQGAETTHRVTLASHPGAGATSIQLSSVPTGWNSGDEIVITGTLGSTSDEVRTIQSINGTSVTLDRALERDHIPPKSDLNVYVANTSRNVQFTSENPAVAHRGHIMFMHNLNVTVANAGFSELGRTDKNRPLDDVFFEFTDGAVGNETSAGTVFTTMPGPATNIRGRYPVHFHRGGTDPGSTPAVIDGSVVNGSPGWGFVNHSANVNMTDNVAYGVQGAAFYTEAGDEIGSMVGNIAIRTVSPTFTLDDAGAIDPDLRADVQDFGVDGDGFWLSGHMVSLRDNVSAGASGHGLIIWSDGLVEADTDRGRTTVKTSDVANGHLITGRDTIPTWWAPLAEISNNESYGATIGFRSRYVHSAGYLGEIGSDFHTPPNQAYIDTLNPTVDGLTVWGSRDGVLLNYNERMSLKNVRLIGIGAPYVQNGGTADTGVGIDMYNEVSRGPGVIENVSIEGFNMGLLAPRQDQWAITNLQLSNTTDMLITEARQAARVLDMNNVTFGDLAATAVAGHDNQRRNIVMEADLEADAHQPYWFLLSDRITLNGQGLYFDQQAGNHVPVESLDQSELVAPVSTEFVGQTNQQLQDRYGTSFGGAIIPADATTAAFVIGGVVGSVAPSALTYPPLYHMASEGGAGVLVDPGTLTNFDGAVPGPGGDDGGTDGDGETDGGDDEGTDDEGTDDGGTDDGGEDDEGADEEGDEAGDDEESGDEGGDDAEEGDEESDDMDDDPDEDAASEEDDEEAGDDEESDDEGDEDDQEDDDGDSDGDQAGDEEAGDLASLIEQLNRLTDDEVDVLIRSLDVDEDEREEIGELVAEIRGLDDEERTELLGELDDEEREELTQILRELLGDDEGDSGDGDPGDDEPDNGEDDGPDGGDTGSETGDHDHDDGGAGGGHTDDGHNHGDQMCSAHPGNPVLAGEHCAAMMLATPKAATHSVVVSGNWSDPAVWQNGTVPTDGADVYIPAGMTLTVEGLISETLHTIRIDGTLRFDPTVNTELRVDTIVGSPTSRFEMGTADNPIADGVTARVVVADTGAIDRTWDPHALSRGLILHGTSVIHGEAKSSWSTTAVAPRAGDTSLTLSAAPDNWIVGDTLVIAGTNIDATGDEVATIAAIDGTTITLDRALQFDHVPPSGDLSVHIANTTRNAVIESENPALDRRGHVMFMHSRGVQIAYGGFYDLGRTNKLEVVDNAVVDQNGQLEPGTGTNVSGRYSVHFHRNGVKADSAPSTVIGSAVVGSPGWGYVNHSSYVDMRDNVSYDVSGAAFNTEAGDEIGSFINNLSIKTHGTGQSPVERQGDQDFGHAGDGFWFQGPGVTIEGNVAAGATGSGLIIYADGLVQEGLGKATFLAENLTDPSLANGAETVPVVLVPIRSFRNNTAYGSIEGVRMYYHRTPVQLEPNEIDQQAQYQWQFPDSVIEGITAWNNATGMRLNYTLDTIFRNLRIVNAPEQVGDIGFDVTNVYNRGRHTYENFTVEGFATGVIPSPNGDITINGGHFNNGVDFQVLEPRQTHRRMEFTGDIQFGDLAGVQTDDDFIERQNIVMQADPRVVVDSFENWFLLNDRVILNFGDYDGQQLYFAEQAADHVLFTEQPEQATPDDPGPDVDEQFIGRTNAELQAQFGSSFGGTLLPDDAIDAPNDGIVGMIGTATPDPGPLPDPEGDDPDDDGADEELCDEEGEELNDDESDAEPSGDEEELQPEDEEESCGGEDEMSDEDDEPDEVDDNDEGSEESGGSDGEAEDGDDETDADGESGEDDDPADGEDGDTDGGDNPDDESDDGDDMDDEDDDIDEGDDEPDGDPGEDDDEDEPDDEVSGDDEDDGESGGDDEEADDDEVDDQDDDGSDAEAGDIFAISAVLAGTSESEKLQGFESDDVITGGGGPDLFPFTAGNDVITDFNPAEDMIDVGDFARLSDDFATLTSLSDIAAASTEITDINGVKSLVIDVDGALGDSTTTLTGVSLDDLNESNVFFGQGDTSIPPLDFTHIPETTVTLNDGTVARFPGHDLSVHPLPFELVSGSQASVDAFNGVASASDEETEDDESGDNDAGESDVADDQSGEAMSAQAEALDAQLGLHTSGQYHENWGRRAEKWVRGDDGWYFILNDGAVHRWNRTSRAEGELVIVLSSAYYDDPTLLTEAAERAAEGSTPAGAGASSALSEVAEQLDAELGLRFTGNDHVNWGGLGEKWIRGNDGWYFITPDGSFYRWNRTGRATGERIASLDNLFHHDLSWLTDAV